MRSMNRPTLLLILFLSWGSIISIDQTYSQNSSTGTAENEKYLIEAQVETGELKVDVKNKIRSKHIKYSKKIMLVDNIRRVLFLNEKSFLVVGRFTAGNALLIATVKDDNTIRIETEFRVTAYYLNLDKTILIYSNWAPTAGPTYLI